MEDLIPISEHNGKQAVSARLLHEFLESKKDFSSWMKDRIERYGFMPGIDYEVFTQTGENPNGGRPTIEYALTIDAAKEISMVEGNERGKQARRYFIECEKKYKESKVLDFSNPDTVLMLAQNWKEEQNKRLEAERRNAVLQPKALFADAVATSSRCCLIAELAKVLQQNGIPIGQNRLFSWMRENGYLCSRGDYYNQPTQKSMELGLFEIKKTTINKPDGTVLITTTTKVTGKGQVYFVNKFLNSDYQSNGIAI